MKTCFEKNLFLVPALIATLNLIPAGRVTAQTFTTLHSFTTTACTGCPNSDGAGSYAGLVTNSSGDILYGTARVGGSSGQGTVFAVNTDGTGAIRTAVRKDVAKTACAPASRLAFSPV